MKRSYSWLLLPVALLSVAIVVTLSLPREERPLLTEPASWRHNANIAPERVDGWYILTDRTDVLYWIAFARTGDGAGKLLSAAFTAPRWVSLAVSGDLTRPGNDVYFQLEGQERRVPVRARTEERYWRRVTLALPTDWVGKQIRLIADAGPRERTNWFGLSNPRALTPGTVFQTQLRTLAFLPAYIVALLLFLLPGMVPAIHFVKRSVVAPVLLLPLAIVFSSVAGYVAFWLFFFSPKFGQYFSAGLFVASVLALFGELRSLGESRSLLARREVWTSLTLTMLVGLFVLAVLFSVDLEIGFEGQPRLRFFEFTLALDNEIPYHFAERLYKGEDPRDIAPGWHSSDRPPLQTGLILLQLPFGHLLGEPRLYSLAVGIALQTAWMPALWALWASAGLSRRQAGLALLFVVLSGFALVNTAFAWPKLLSAALALFAVSIGLFDRGPAGQVLSLPRAVLLGLSAAMASLGHGGVAFTLLPFGLLLLLPRWYPGLSRLAAAAVVYVAAMLPWTLYQRSYDPPGTKLLKLHLAGDNREGDTNTWQDKRPLWQNVIAAYQATGTEKVFQNKLANFKVLFAAAPDQYSWPPHEAPPEWPVDATGFRRCDFLSLFWSLGILNIGWLVALASFLRGRPMLDPTLSGTVPLLCVASIVIWVAIMFGPGATVIHQGSYATFVLLFASLAAWLTTLPGRWPLVLLLAQGVVFAAGWLLTSPANAFGPANVFMAPLAVLFIAWLAWFAIGSAADDKVVETTAGATT